MARRRLTRSHFGDPTRARSTHGLDPARVMVVTPRTEDGLDILTREEIAKRNLITWIDFSQMVGISNNNTLRKRFYREKAYGHSWFPQAVGITSETVTKTPGLGGRHDIELYRMSDLKEWLVCRAIKGAHTKYKEN